MEERRRREGMAAVEGRRRGLLAWHREEDTRGRWRHGLGRGGGGPCMEEGRGRRRRGEVEPEGARAPATAERGGEYLRGEVAGCTRRSAVAGREAGAAAERRRGRNPAS
jgi:hypothetical protein